MMRKWYCSSSKVATRMNRGDDEEGVVWRNIKW